MNEAAGFLGTLARRIVRGLVRLYYPRFEVSNPERIPTSGPALFAANHPNSVLDPVVVGISVKRPVRFLAKAPLFKVPVFGSMLRALGMLPAYRESDDPTQVGKNTESLGAGADLLVKGEAFGIFPEGKTHDAPKVEMVRSGAARIAMQAVEQGAKGLKIVPLGINYEDKERFRTAVWVRVGEPIDADAWVRQHGGDTRHAMRALTRELERQLKELTVHFNEETWAGLLPDVERFFPPPADLVQSPASNVRLRKRIADAMNYFLATAKPRAERAAAEMAKHREALARLGLEMRSPLLNRSGLALFARMLWEPLWLLGLLIPALAGTLHHILPFTLVRLIAPRVQTPGRTTVSFARLGLSVPIYAVWYGFVWWWWSELRGYDPALVGAWLALMPFCGLLALGYWPRAIEAGSLWWHEIRLGLRRGELNALREERLALRKTLLEMGEEFAKTGPASAPTAPAAHAPAPPQSS
ncbi:MAG: 1-acyl-sn-glycerol-3-phosphate acyltransferase [Planctomycetes bacterium]|nr:1-acyl-sn-glycerol-3-phosphate acyltransferase [Planctomycetota bacterium]